MAHPQGHCSAIFAEITLWRIRSNQSNSFIWNVNVMLFPIKQSISQSVYCFRPSFSLIFYFFSHRTERQWRDLAFCLSMLSYNERGIRKLQENFTCFHDKLAEEDVYQSFLTIVGKSKKFAKPEVKVTLILCVKPSPSRMIN